MAFALAEEGRAIRVWRRDGEATVVEVVPFTPFLLLAEQPRCLPEALAARDLCRQRSGLPWDTPELHAMLADMLNPPEVDAEDLQSVSGSIGKERAAADLDDGETEPDDAEQRPGA